MATSILLLYQKPMVPEGGPLRAIRKLDGQNKDKKIEQRGRKIEDPDLEIDIPGSKDSRKV